MTWLGRLVVGVSEGTVQLEGGVPGLLEKGEQRVKRRRRAGGPGCASQGGSCSCRNRVKGVSSGRGQESGKMEILGIISRTRRRSPDSGNNFKSFETG